MRRAVFVAGIVSAGCGRFGFDSAPLEAKDAAPDAVDAGDAFALDTGFPITANNNQATGTMLSTVPITFGPHRLIVAVFVWGTGGTDESPLEVTSPNLVWTRQVFSTFLPGSVPPGTSGDGIWTATTDNTGVANEILTVSRGSTVETAVMTVGVYSFTGAKVGASGTHTDQTGNTPLLVDVETLPGDIVIGGFHHGTANMVRAPNAATQWDLIDDPSVAPNGHFHGVGRLIGTSPGGTITLGSSTTGPYSLTSGIAITPQ